MPHLWPGAMSPLGDGVIIGNHLLSFVYNFIMTIMEKNAIWFIVFLEISLDKFIWDGKCQRAEVRRMFLGVCSLGNYGIVK